MIDKPIIILILTFLIALFTYSCWELIKEKTGIRIFYPGIGLSFVGYTFVIKLLFKRLAKYEKKFKCFIPLTTIIHLSTVNNIVDELFFDPTMLQFNEYLGFLLIIIITILEWNHFQKKKKRISTKDLLP